LLLSILILQGHQTVAMLDHIVCGESDFYLFGADELVVVCLFDLLYKSLLQTLKDKSIDLGLGNVNIALNVVFDFGLL